MADDFNKITGLPPEKVGGIGGAPSAPKPAPGDRPSFSEMIGDAILQVDKLHKTAENASEKLVTGELQDVHQVVVAMEEAQTSFKLLMEIRNKMMEAYREVMKSQV